MRFNIFGAPQVYGLPSHSWYAEINIRVRV